MRADDQRGVCPLCGDPNSYTATHCRRCSFRLPWAHAAQETSPDSPPSTEVPTSSKAADDRADDRADDCADDRFDFFPDEKRNCRYCDAQLQVNTRQCPQCKMWLGSAPHLFDADPWQPDYDKDATRRVDTIQPTGCLAGGPRLLLLALVAHFFFS